MSVALAAAFVLSIGGGVRWGLLAQVLPPGQYVLAHVASDGAVQFETRRWYDFTARVAARREEQSARAGE